MSLTTTRRRPPRPRRPPRRRPRPRRDPDRRVDLDDARARRRRRTCPTASTVSGCAAGGPARAASDCPLPATPAEAELAGAPLQALTALLKAETPELRQKARQRPAWLRERAVGSGAGPARRWRWLWLARLAGGFSGGSGGSGELGRRPGSRLGSGSGASGAGSGSGGGRAAARPAILQTTSTQLVVTVDLDATKQSEAVVGEPVTVELPDGEHRRRQDHRGQPGRRRRAARHSSSGSGSGGGGSAEAARGASRRRRSR